MKKAKQLVISGAVLVLCAIVLHLVCMLGIYFHVRKTERNAARWGSIGVRNKLEKKNKSQDSAYSSSLSLQHLGISHTLLYACLEW